MTPARGELWWCETPDAGRRPCIVLTRDQAIPRLRRVLVAYASTNERGLDTEVVLDPSEEPVRLRCVLQLDSTQSVSIGLLVQRMGRLSDDRMREVCSALAVAIDCR
ncbi:MAG: type II toxin-antitoxin system PemK/MazF family toxin [Ilumatobacteraceae bacterium]